MSRLLSPSDLEALPITYRQAIPESYRDLMGHMNVMWYTHLFGCAFEGFAGQFGFGEDYFRHHHTGSFALETHVRYLSEVRIGWNITIRSRAIARSEKRVHFMHFMTIDESGLIAAMQEHVGAHIDMRTRRMSPFPTELAAKLDDLIGRQNDLPWPAPICGVMRP